jgi:hypothetical protein
MKNRLIVAYILNLIDMVMVLCSNNIDSCRIRLFALDATAFMFMKVILIAASLYCTWCEYRNNQTHERYYNIKSYFWLYLYVFTVIHDCMFLFI